jgi:hypothetical protein
VLKPQGGNCAVLPYHNQNAEAIQQPQRASPLWLLLLVPFFTR